MHCTDEFLEEIGGRDDAERAYFRAWHEYALAKSALETARSALVEFGPGEGHGVSVSLKMKPSTVDWPRLYEALGLCKEQFDALYRVNTGEMVPSVRLIR